MTQHPLWTQTNANQKRVSVENIKAIFTELEEKVYEVLLEISSHKFFIAMSRTDEEIEHFEIIACKGYMNINHESVNTLKKLTDHLRYRQ